MGLELSISQGTKQSMQLLQQSMQLSQRIELCKLMEVPDEVLNTIFGAVCLNPDSIEAKLTEIKNRGDSNPDGFGSDISNKVQNLYASLTPSKGDADAVKHGGMIMSPDLSALESCFERYPSNATPDVTYIGRKGNKPEIVFSDHIKGYMGLKMLNLDSEKYPRASKLIAKLKRFDEWKRATLIDSYVLIGGAQREFFEDLDKTRLQSFMTSNLTKALGYHHSTIGRLLCNRWAELRNLKGEQKFIYTKDLLVTEDEMKKYNALPVLNKILAEEFKRGKAFSDRQIIEKIPFLARRTIAKYRQFLGIPGTPERNRGYRTGERTEAYQVT